MYYLSTHGLRGIDEICKCKSYRSLDVTLEHPLDNLSESETVRAAQNGQLPERLKTRARVFLETLRPFKT
jgi:hypothetical protein